MLELVAFIVVAAATMAAMPTIGFDSEIARITVGVGLGYLAALAMRGGQRARKRTRTGQRVDTPDG